jgi:hypothetical protein
MSLIAKNEIGVSMLSLAKQGETKFLGRTKQPPCLRKWQTNSFQEFVNKKVTAPRLLSRVYQYKSLVSDLNYNLDGSRMKIVRNNWEKTNHFLFYIFLYGNGIENDGRLNKNSYVRKSETEQLGWEHIDNRSKADNSYQEHRYIWLLEMFNSNTRR